MGNTSAPSVNTQCNYLGLTNTAHRGSPESRHVTGGRPRSRQTVSRALADLHQQRYYADGARHAAHWDVVGTTRSTTYYYWVAACNQGICTTPSAGSTAVTTANATLSTTNYVSVVDAGRGRRDLPVVPDHFEFGTQRNGVGASRQPAGLQFDHVLITDTSNTLKLVTIEVEPNQFRFVHAGPHLDRYRIAVRSGVRRLPLQLSVAGTM